MAENLLPLPRLPRLPELPVDAVLIVYTHHSIAQAHIYANVRYANIGESQTKATAFLILHHIEPPLTGSELNVSDDYGNDEKTLTTNSYAGETGAATMRQFHPSLCERLRSRG